MLYILGDWGPEKLSCPISYTYQVAEWHAHDSRVSNLNHNIPLSITKKSQRACEHTLQEMPRAYIAEEKNQVIWVILGFFQDYGLNRKLLEPFESIQLLRDMLIENTTNTAGWSSPAQSHSQSLRNGL